MKKMEAVAGEIRNGDEDGNYRRAKESSFLPSFLPSFY
jgi:hypothetical protein